MTAWVIDAFLRLLLLVGQTWSATPDAVKTIIVAAFGTLIGAFLASRSQAKRRVIEELRALHAAYTVSFAIINKALAIKRQHIHPMKEEFDGVVAVYDAWMEHQRGQPPTIGLNMKTLSKVRSANATLEKTVFEKVSLGHKGLAAALSLEDATDELNASIDYRNNLVSDFQKNGPEATEERIHLYVGAYREGQVDTRFADNIEALSRQADDCIFFGTILSEELFKRERIVRARNWWKYRLSEVPRQYPADWTIAREAGLMPDAMLYADWLRGFKKPPPLWRRFLDRIKQVFVRFKKLIPNP